MNKLTAVLGASPNPHRTSYLAVQRLLKQGYQVVPLGIRKGKIDDVEIITEWPKTIENLHTITLYIGPDNQPPHYDYILGLKPKRIIFNPGTENQELLTLAQKQGIEVEVACNLVMLSLGVF